MNSFFAAQLNYCPVKGMIHSRFNNNRVNHVHKRFLRLIYRDKTCSHEEVLEKDILVSILYKNIEALAQTVCHGSKTYLQKCGSKMWFTNVEKRTYRIKTELFSKNLRIYQIIATFTLRVGCVKLT